MARYSLLLGGGGPQGDSSPWGSWFLLNQLTLHLGSPEQGRRVHWSYCVCFAADPLPRDSLGLVFIAKMDTSGELAIPRLEAFGQTILHGGTETSGQASAGRREREAAQTSPCLGGPAPLHGGGVGILSPLHGGGEGAVWPPAQQLAGTASLHRVTHQTRLLVPVFSVLGAQ